MGNKQTTFSEEQLEAYQDCTFFTRKEILRVFERFKEVNPDIVPAIMTNQLSSTFKMPHRDIENMVELKENPFKRRITRVFSEDSSGNMSFDDFLDMFSVFGESAPRDLKAVYAFKIYDYDGDGQLGKGDLRHVINALTKHELTFEEVDFFCDKVLEEADYEDNGFISYTEFEHIISRAPDFLSTFHIRI